MSMNASYRRLSGRLLEALARDPSLTNAVIYFDAGAAGGDPPIPPDIREMVAQLEPEIREKFLSDYRAQLSQLGLGEMFSDLAADAAKRFSDAGLDASDVGDALGIEKAWHGLHFLLAGTQWEPTEPPGNVVLGGVEIGEDLGYGPARLLSPSETAAAARSLERLNEAHIKAGFDPKAFQAAEIYGGDWDDPEEREWILDAFRRVRSYFGQASSAGQGMLIFLT